MFEGNSKETKERAKAKTHTLADPPEPHFGAKSLYTISIQWQYMKGAYEKEEEQLFTQASIERTRGNSFKWKEERFILDVI